MYQLHVTVQEFPSVWRVFYAFSLRNEDGSVNPFGTRETWVERSEDDVDALTEALQALARAVRTELRPIR